MGRAPRTKGIRGEEAIVVYLFSTCQYLDCSSEILNEMPKELRAPHIVCMKLRNLRRRRSRPGSAKPNYLEIQDFKLNIGLNYGAFVLILRARHIRKRFRDVYCFISFEITSCLCFDQQKKKNEENPECLFTYFN